MSQIELLCRSATNLLDLRPSNCVFMASQEIESSVAPNDCGNVSRAQKNRYLSLKHDLLKLQPLIWRNHALALRYVVEHCRH